MEKFKIGGQYYKVERLPDLAMNEGKGGETQFYTKTIRLQEGMERQFESETILHELVHGMLYMLGEHEKNQDEEAVNRIAQGIIMLVSDNKDFFRQLLE